MSASAFAPPPILKLRDGERLSRDEFERRYEAVPDVKAELLDGVVYIMSSPISVDHGQSDGDLMGWLSYYKAFTPGVDAGHNATTRLPNGSEPQPDAYLRILESNGGNSYVDEDRYLSGVPELLGEVAKSGKSYDLTVKKPIYRQDGVREYLWRVEDKAIDWFVLRNDVYDELRPGPDGILRSEKFPGLWLDAVAMIRRDGATVLRVLQRGIESPEHGEFVERLRQTAKSRA